MSKSIYRKLKDYIKKIECGSISIFGTLYDSSNIYSYKDEEGNYKTYNCCGTRSKGEMEFLLDYYVIGIYPAYEIVKDKIIVKLVVCLQKEKEYD